MPNQVGNPLLLASQLLGDIQSEHLLCFIDNISVSNNIKEIWKKFLLITTRQHLCLNICRYIGLIDKYCIYHFNQYIYKYWDGDAV